MNDKEDDKSGKEAPEDTTSTNEDQPSNDSVLNEPGSDTNNAQNENPDAAENNSCEDNKAEQDQEATIEAGAEAKQDKSATEPPPIQDIQQTDTEDPYLDVELSAKNIGISATDTKGDLNIAVENFNIVNDASASAFTDPTEESPPLPNKFKAYEAKDDISKGISYLKSNRVIFLHQTETNKEEIESTYYTIRSILEKDGYAFRHGTQEFDLRYYYLYPNNFLYKAPTVTLLDWPDSFSTIKYLLIRNNAQQIRRALEKHNNHLIVITQVDIESIVKRISLPEHGLHILTPATIPLSSDSPPPTQSFATREPITAAILFLVSFFPGLRQPCIDTLMELLLEDDSVDASEPTENEQDNTLTPLDLWRNNADEYITQCGIIYGLDDKKSGYLFEEPTNERNIRQHLLGHYRNYLNKQLSKLTEFYFSDRPDYNAFDNGYARYLRKLRQHDIVAIDAQWLMGKFEPNRVLNRKNFNGIRRFYKLIERLYYHTETAPMVVEFFNLLGRRCLLEQNKWLNSLRDYNSLCELFAAFPSLRKSRLMELAEKAPEVSNFIALNELTFAMHYLIRNSIGLGEARAFQWILQLVKKPKLERGLDRLLEENKLDPNVVFPLVMVTRKALLSYLGLDFDQYRNFALHWKLELDAECQEEGETMAMPLKELAPICTTILSRELARFTASDKTDPSLFVSQLFDSNDSADLLAYLATSPLLHDFADKDDPDAAEMKTIHYLHWLQKLYENLAVVYSLQWRNKKDTDQSGFCAYTTAAKNNLKIADQASIMEIISDLVEPYSDNLRLIISDKDKDAHVLAENRWLGLQLLWKCWRTA